MNIKFYNLGTLKETELDLRSLTVIIGPNNSNKTYLAYSVYRTWSIIQSRLEQFVLLTESKQDTNVPDFMVNLEKLGKEEIDSTFGTFEDFFQDSSHQIFSKTESMFSFSKQEVEEFAKVLMTQPPFLLPAERNALVINYKLLNHRRFQLLEQLRKRSGKGEDLQKQFGMLRESGDTRYPQPVEDFLDFLVGLDFQPTTKIDSANKNDFQKLADTLEKHLQGNHKTVLTPTLLGGKEIQVEIKRGLRIDLYNASSSIKQLAPLLLYLRYRAKTGDLLIIDEPETGLHPESQAKLLEVLGILVYLGVRVLITTHSPYFVSHLNNLVAGDMNNLNALKKQAKSLYLKDSRAFILLEQVSAYEMQNNQLVSLKDEDYGIRWGSLSDVSSDLQQKNFQIYEAENAHFFHSRERN